MHLLIDICEFLTKSQRKLNTAIMINETRQNAKKMWQQSLQMENFKLNQKKSCKNKKFKELRINALKTKRYQPISF